MPFYLIEGEELRTSDGREWFHGGLDIDEFRQVAYSPDFTKAAVKTTQNLEDLNEITETQFEQFKATWDAEKALVEQEMAQTIEGRLTELEQVVADLISLKLGV